MRMDCLITWPDDLSDAPVAANSQRNPVREIHSPKVYMPIGTHDAKESCGLDDEEVSSRPLSQLGPECVNEIIADHAVVIWLQGIVELRQLHDTFLFHARMSIEEPDGRFSVV